MPLISGLGSAVFSVAVASALVACGGETTENVTTINQLGMEIFASEDDLPECTDDNEGEQAFVKESGATMICVAGDWVSTNPEGAVNVDFGCKTEELKDKSGLKIVCNGDSIGVVLNGTDGKDGEKGEAGKAGAGCSMTDRTDSTITVVCGDSTMVIETGNEAKNDTAVYDSERVAISLDSLAGYTQKGPFLRGASVYLYELSDGRTLKQTNGNFTSKITREDGHWRHGTELDSVLKQSCTAARIGASIQASESLWYMCEEDSLVVGESRWNSARKKADCNSKSVYSDGRLLKGTDGEWYKCDTEKFELATPADVEFGRGCVSYIVDRNNKFGKMQYSYTCTASREWALDRENTLTDPRDGKTYRTTTIGVYVVMAEDLDFTYYDGVQNQDMEGYPEEYAQDGLHLYSWCTAMDSLHLFSDSSYGGKTCLEARNIPGHARGICPEGWHIPKGSEWIQLYNAVDSSAVSLQSMGYIRYWPEATNSSGFSARPTGYAKPTGYMSGDSFGETDSVAYYWTSEHFSSLYNDTYGYFRSSLLDEDSSRRYLHQSLHDGNITSYMWRISRDKAQLGAADYGPSGTTSMHRLAVRCFKDY